MGALIAGISGMKAHQKMIDVAGNNLANLNTTAYKSSRVTFSELFSETLREASQSTGSVGGTNPMQIGSGVGVSSIGKNMTQGSMVNTGQSLDMAIEGDGFFTLNDGKQDVYTRAGSFAVDSNFNLVDPTTGCRVQRIGSEGLSDGFQSAINNDIRIPYDIALPATSTENITYTGNLSADDNTPGTNHLSCLIDYTKDGTAVFDDALIADMDQATGIVDGDQITIAGTDRDGNAVNTSLTITAATTTVGDLLTAISTAFSGSTATIINGNIRLVDDASGYSQTDLNLGFSGTGSLETPAYFEVLGAGGQAVKNTNIEIFDSRGVSRTLSASMVKTDTTNMWDMVLTSVGDNVEVVDRRIKGITFLSDGSYGGIGGATPDTSTFQLRFGHDPNNTRTININLGTVGKFDGLTQFGGSSTMAPGGQDGYASGWLSSVSVTSEGIISGTFTNGMRRDIAAIKLATFQNPAGMESIGNNYYISSGNSGTPVCSKAMTGTAGAINGMSLEKSNVQVAEEFVNMIQAQNGFQANARTITVANEMLKELTNLIR